MNNLRLCTHYGFGDYVICYGMVKELAKDYNMIFLFVLPHRSPLHIANIRRLYSSIKNVEVVLEDPWSYEDTAFVGWNSLARAIANGYSEPFPKFFYAQVGVPINLMWDNFYFERNMAKEKEIYYDRLGLKDGDEYVFLHDDPTRGFVIDRLFVTPDIRVIHLSELEDVSILDTLYLVEKSREVHASVTGIVPFIDLMSIEHSRLNLHRYIRSLPFDQPLLRLKWNIIG